MLGVCLRVIGFGVGFDLLGWVCFINSVVISFVIVRCLFVVLRVVLFVFWLLLNSCFTRCVLYIFLCLFVMFI